MKRTFEIFRNTSAEYKFFRDETSDKFFMLSYTNTRDSWFLYRPRDIILDSFS